MLLVFAVPCAPGTDRAVLSDGEVVVESYMLCDETELVEVATDRMLAALPDEPELVVDTELWRLMSFIVEACCSCVEKMEEDVLYVIVVVDGTPDNTC